MARNPFPNDVATADPKNVQNLVKIHTMFDLIVKHQISKGTLSKARVATKYAHGDNMEPSY